MKAKKKAAPEEREWIAGQVVGPNRCSGKEIAKKLKAIEGVKVIVSGPATATFKATTAAKNKAKAALKEFCVIAAPAVFHPVRPHPGRVDRRG